MAPVVASQLFAPPSTPHHPKLLEKAARPGRIQGVAVDILTAIQEQPLHAQQILKDSLRQARQLHSRERRFVSDGLYQILRYRSVIDEALGVHDPLARWYGYLAWQGAQTDALVNAYQTLNAASHPNFENMHRVQEWVAQQIQCRPLDEAASLLGGFSTPSTSILLQALAEDFWAFLSASNQRAPVDIRANPHRCDRERLRSALAERGIHTQPIESTEHGLRLENKANLHGHPAWQQGWFEVQDAGSQQVASFCSPITGPVVDFCAGAGGKTLALASLHPNRHILALDVREHALTELQKRAKRARLHRVQVETMPPNGALPPTAKHLIGKTHCVLVDAPCTGTGTLRRHPEIRLRFSPSELKHCVELQASILRRAAPLVAPGGKLIYATCSVLPEENEYQAQRFLAEHEDFHQVGEPLHLLPHVHHTDGFYAVSLARKTS